MHAPVSTAHDYTLSAIDWGRDVPRLRGAERQEAADNAKSMLLAAQQILAELPDQVYRETLELHRELSAPALEGFPAGVPFKFRALEVLIPNRHRFALEKEGARSSLRVANL
jgi:hypothetical protein